MDKVKKVKTPELDILEKKMNITKWIPFICAGAAIGVGIIALKEIKNVREELLTLKQIKPDSTTLLCMERMQTQISSLNERISKNNISKFQPTVVDVKEEKKNNIIKNATVIEKEVNIINEDDGDEYEEIEVTDDELEES